MSEFVSQFGPLWGTIAVIGQILAFMIVLLISLAFLLLMDRKVWAAVQMRKGPNVVGAFGLLQSFADFFKFVFKEIVVPAGADRSLYLLAPLITLIPISVRASRVRSSRLACLDSMYEWHRCTE